MPIDITARKAVTIVPNATLAIYEGGTHANDFKRIAVVTDSQWVTWSALLSQTFVNADVEVFDNADEARQWLDSAA